VQASHDVVPVAARKIRFFTSSFCILASALIILSGGVRQRNVTRENRTLFVAFMDDNHYLNRIRTLASQLLSHSRNGSTIKPRI